MFRVIGMKKELGRKILPVSFLSVGGKCKQEEFTILYRVSTPEELKSF